MDCRFGRRTNSNENNRNNLVSEKRHLDRNERPEAMSSISFVVQYIHLAYDLFLIRAPIFWPTMPSNGIIIGAWCLCDCVCVCVCQRHESILLLFQNCSEFEMAEAYGVKCIWASHMNCINLFARIMYRYSSERGRCIVHNMASIRWPNV